MKNDPYQTLGVSKTATQDEIKAAYRKLARKHHPDLNPGSKESERKFKDMQNAYDKIETSEKRAHFDRGEVDEAAANTAGASQGFRSRGGPFYSETQGDPGARYGSRFSQEFNYDDLASMFGSNRPRGDARGEDMLYRIRISFRDMTVGAEPEITLPTGKKMKIQVPAGVSTGARLRFAGMGQPSSGKAPAGDLYLEIEVEESPLFTRKGFDVETELPISLSEAILGGEVPAPTPDGAVRVKIPPGSNSGARLRLKGKGIMDSRSGNRGDLYARLKLVLPDAPNAIDDEFREATRAWNLRHPYDPRGKTERTESA